MKDSAAKRSPAAPEGTFERLLERLGTGPLWIAGAGIVLTVVFGELPGDDRFSAVFQDGCHAPAFAVLSLITLTLLARHARRLEGASGAQTRTTARTAFVQSAATVVAMSLLGAATEGLQDLLGRDAEFDDVVSDVVGSLAGAGLWVYLHMQARADATARIARSVALLVCAGALWFWSNPLLRCANAYWHRDTQFPVLAQFRSQRDLYFVKSSARQTRIVAAGQSANQGESGTALQVGLDSGRWPGITLAEPVPDWRGYGALALDLSNPGSTALPLHLRINDREHNGALDDRFNIRLLLPPNVRTTIRIPVEQIARSPRTRRMDMSRIATVILFRDGSAPGEVVVLHRVWLEQASVTGR
jgi:hypothetical protein